MAGPTPVAHSTTRPATTPPAAQATVPNLYGATRSEATTILHQAGFYNISFSEGCSTTGLHDVVNSQTPVAGVTTAVTAPVGMHIHILNCASISNVVGWRMDNAADYLRRTGWTPVAGNGGCVSGNNGVVATMSPQGGSFARPGSQIRLDPGCL
ncbi:PASTA domain-containing protein [Frankia sp. Cr2]|uniref:PASTA domain-containing protein n=1 Tax=Frankia sp. Cr2 TaxID=3073932 RepID=UPI002AD41227|nr:PASTA domain-containing protein [Frankia sp. Cr2]